MGCWTGQAGSWGHKWSPPASASGEGEELAAWGELQEEEGGPEALAGVKKSRRDPSGPSCHPAPAKDVVPVSVGFAPSPLSEASGSQ